MSQHTPHPQMTQNYNPTINTYLPATITNNTTETTNVDALLKENQQLRKINSDLLNDLTITNNNFKITHQTFLFTKSEMFKVLQSNINQLVQIRNQYHTLAEKLLGATIDTRSTISLDLEKELGAAMHYIKQTIDCLNYHAWQQYADLLTQCDTLKQSLYQQNEQNKLKEKTIFCLQEQLKKKDIAIIAMIQEMYLSREQLKHIPNLKEQIEQQNIIINTLHTSINAIYPNQYAPPYPSTSSEAPLKMMDSDNIAFNSGRYETNMEKNADYIIPNPVTLTANSTNIPLLGTSFIPLDLTQDTFYTPDTNNL